MAVKLLGNKNISIVVPIMVIGIVLLFFVPIPTFMLDSFQAINITIGVTILLMSMYVKEPLHFSIFPSVLLITALCQLVLVKKIKKIELS